MLAAEWRNSLEFISPAVSGLGCVSGGHENSLYICDVSNQSSGALLTFWLADMCWDRLLVLSWRLASDDYSYRSGIDQWIWAKYMKIVSSGTSLRCFLIATYLEPKFRTDHVDRHPLNNDQWVYVTARVLLPNSFRELIQLKPTLVVSVARYPADNQVQPFQLWPLQTVFYSKWPDCVSTALTLGKDLWLHILAKMS